MFRTVTHLTLAAGALALPSVASAQHADFVLFGERSAQADDSPEHRFVHPVSSPYYHEDSFVTSDVRAWYVYHEVPGGSTLGGGDIQVAAVQFRLAITDKIQFVAYKDGYMWINTDGLDDSGWNDLAAGLKWNFIQDWENQFHMAAGAGYQFGIGDEDVLQEDDQFRVWASINKGFDKFHLGGTMNLFLASDEDDDDDGLGNSDWLSWHLHADYWINEHISPVVELNGYHVLDEGVEVIPESGLDVINLGGGDDVITMALGGEYRFTEQLAARAAYEFPLTSGDDLFDWRVTLSLVFSF
jgi:hypothetical protein